MAKVILKYSLGCFLGQVVARGDRWFPVYKGAGMNKQPRPGPWERDTIEQNQEAQLEDLVTVIRFETECCVHRRHVL